MLSVGQALLNRNWLILDALVGVASYVYVEQFYKGIDKTLYQAFLDCHHCALRDPNFAPSIQSCQNAALEKRNITNQTYSQECRPPCTAPKCLMIWVAGRTLEESALGTTARYALKFFNVALSHASFILSKELYLLSRRFA